jgi:hypothetical protein
MKWLALWVAVLTLGLAVASHATTTFYLYQYNTTNTTGSVAAGGTYDFWVTTSTTNPFVGAAYRVVLPTTDWLLDARDYGTYGWDTTPIASSGWDGSLPLQTATSYPYTITDAFYAATPSDADFTFSTSRADLVNVSGNITVEKFTLTIPASTTPNTYSLSLWDPRTYNIEGDPADGTVSVGDPFQLTVTNATVPEPASLALFGFGLIGLAYLRRRRAA